MAAEFDYIVFGSGAGGGPLAANLALDPRGFRVALVEAGGDMRGDPGSASDYSTAVPALHPYASEDESHSWAYFVEHYDAPARQAKDPKRTKRGVLYPRAGALGGCTAIHALVTMYPHHLDWAGLQTLTGDESWSPQRMRGYYERMEQWREAPSAPPGRTVDPTTRRGLAGWLPVSVPDPLLLLDDEKLQSIFFNAFLIGSLVADQDRPRAALEAGIGRLLRAAGRGGLPAGTAGLVAGVSRALAAAKEGAAPELVEAARRADDLSQLFRLTATRLDPNRWFATDAERVGAFSVPTSTLDGVRSAARERVLSVRAAYPERLVLIPNALVTKVVFDGKKATGVRLARSEKPLYRATREAKAELPPQEELRLRPGGEVVLACGAFNTPQVLMLSGVGPAAELKKHGIKPVHELEGVGGNLHDRYESSVVYEMKEDFVALNGAKYRPPAGGRPEDTALSEWQNHRGVYTTNGIVLSVIARSKQVTNGVPDLCLFGSPGDFRGYEPCYSRRVLADHRHFTWAVLKGRTRNRAGTVRLRSADPRDTPEVRFRYFDEGSEGWEADLAALAEGMQLADRIMKETKLPMKRSHPGIDLGDRGKLEEHLKNEAWGHHACGSCKIGQKGDPAAVVGGDFLVHGLQGLRVVDASVFPDIPGFFIVTPVYMISEKAADVILASRGKAP
jgi:choline dehydrogenase